MHIMVMVKSIFIMLRKGYDHDEHYDEDNETKDYDEDCDDYYSDER